MAAFLLALGWLHAQLPYDAAAEAMLVPITIDLPREMTPVLRGDIYLVHPARPPLWTEPRIGQVEFGDPWTGGSGRKIALLLPRGCLSGRLSVKLAEGGSNRGAGQAQARFRFEESEDRFLRLFQGDRPVLVYNYGMLLKEGAPQRYRRSSYVHPIYGLDGEVLTDDFPRDHYHHRGLFWAWPRVTVGGKTYDPWAVSGMHTRFERWLGRQSGPVVAVFGVNNGWYVGEKKVVDEKVWFRIWRNGPAGRAIDVVLTLEATDEPVTISGRPPYKGYGGFGLRFAPRKGRPAIAIATGRIKKDLIRTTRSPWADYSARFGDRTTTSGAAIFLHPSHPQFPTGWLLRHYGYIGPTWPGLDKVTLERGKPLRLRYRVWVHRGDAERGRVAQAFEAYAAKPEVKLVGP